MVMEELSMRQDQVILHNLPLSSYITLVNLLLMFNALTNSALYKIINKEQFDLLKFGSIKQLWLI